MAAHLRRPFLIARDHMSISLDNPEPESYPYRHRIELFCGEIAHPEVVTGEQV